jgi:hypothetical protein
MSTPDKRERLAEIMTAEQTLRNGRPSPVFIDADDVVYLLMPHEGREVLARYFVPPEVYDALAVAEEHGGQGFTAQLLPVPDHLKLPVRDDGTPYTVGELADAE